MLGGSNKSEKYEEEEEEKKNFMYLLNQQHWNLQQSRFLILKLIKQSTN